jgi:hypothetical protein
MFIVDAIRGHFAFIDHCLTKLGLPVLPAARTLVWPSQNKS